LVQAKIPRLRFWLAGAEKTQSPQNKKRFRWWRTTQRTMPSLYIAADGIGETIEDKDIEDAFGKFGRIEKIWVARKPPGFAFVDFGDQRDAEDAVDEMNGK
jgi:RNA recognition motif-containing protein